MSLQAIKQKIEIIVRTGVLLVFLGWTFTAFASWAQPVSLPTTAEAGNDTEPPVNVDASPQIKQGGMVVGGSFPSDSADPSFYVMNGRVGVGVLNPREKMEVAGKVRATDFCTSGNPSVCLSGAASTPLGEGVANSIVKWTSPRVLGPSSIYYIPSTGLTGVGTATPTAALQVDDSSIIPAPQSLLKITRINALSGDGSIDRKNAGVYILTKGDGLVVDVYDSQTSATTKPALIVNSAGRMGIGTTSPGSELDVVGTSDFGDIRLGEKVQLTTLNNPSNPTDTANKWLRLFSLSGNQGGISVPRLYIGSSTRPTFTSTFAGNAEFRTDTTFDQGLILGDERRTTWPVFATPTAIKKISTATSSGVILTPNPITDEGSIALDYSKIGKAVDYTCPTGEALRGVKRATGEKICTKVEYASDGGLSSTTINTTASGRVGYLAKFSELDNLDSSVVYQAEDGNLAIGHTQPLARLDMQTAGSQSSFRASPSNEVRNTASDRKNTLYGMTTDTNGLSVAGLGVGPGSTGGKFTATGAGGFAIHSDYGKVMLTGPVGIGVEPAETTTGDPGPFGQIGLRVLGRVGAGHDGTTAFCDQDGNNCTNFSEFAEGARMSSNFWLASSLSSSDIHNGNSGTVVIGSDNNSYDKAKLFVDNSNTSANEGAGYFETSGKRGAAVYGKSEGTTGYGIEANAVGVRSYGISGISSGSGSTAVYSNASGRGGTAVYAQATGTNSVGLNADASDGANNTAIRAVATGASSPAIDAHSKENYGVYTEGATYGAVAAGRGSAGYGARFETERSDALALNMNGKVRISGHAPTVSSIVPGYVLTAENASGVGSWAPLPAFNIDGGDGCVITEDPISGAASFDCGGGYHCSDGSTPIDANTIFDGSGSAASGGSAGGVAMVKSPSPLVAVSPSPSKAALAGLYDHIKQFGKKMIAAIGGANSSPSAIDIRRSTVGLGAPAGTIADISKLRTFDIINTEPVSPGFIISKPPYFPECKFYGQGELGFGGGECTAATQIASENYKMKVGSKLIDIGKWGSIAMSTTTDVTKKYGPCILPATSLDAGISLPTDHVTLSFGNISGTDQTVNVVVTTSGHEYSQEFSVHSIGSIFTPNVYLDGSQAANTVPVEVTSYGRIFYNTGSFAYATCPEGVVVRLASGSGQNICTKDKPLPDMFRSSGNPFCTASGQVPELYIDKSEIKSRCAVSVRLANSPGAEHMISDTLGDGKYTVTAGKASFSSGSNTNFADEVALGPFDVQDRIYGYTTIADKQDCPTAKTIYDENTGETSSYSVGGSGQVVKVRIPGTKVVSVVDTGIHIDPFKRTVKVCKDDDGVNVDCPSLSKLSDNGNGNLTMYSMDSSSNIYKEQVKANVDTQTRATGVYQFEQRAYALPALLQNNTPDRYATVAKSFQEAKDLRDAAILRRARATSAEERRLADNEIASLGNVLAKMQGFIDINTPDTPVEKITSEFNDVEDAIVALAENPQELSVASLFGELLAGFKVEYHVCVGENGYPSAPGTCPVYDNLPIKPAKYSRTSVCTSLPARPLSAERDPGCWRYIGSTKDNVNTYYTSDVNHQLIEHTDTTSHTVSRTYTGISQSKKAEDQLFCKDSHGVDVACPAQFDTSSMFIDGADKGTVLFGGHSLGRGEGVVYGSSGGNGIRYVAFYNCLGTGCYGEILGQEVEELGAGSVSETQGDYLDLWKTSDGKCVTGAEKTAGTVSPMNALYEMAGRSADQTVSLLPENADTDLNYIVFDSRSLNYYISLPSWSSQSRDTLPTATSPGLKNTAEDIKNLSAKDIPAVANATLVEDDTSWIGGDVTCRVHTDNFAGTCGFGEDEYRKIINKEYGYETNQLHDCPDGISFPECSHKLDCLCKITAKVESLQPWRPEVYSGVDAIALDITYHPEKRPKVEVWGQPKKIITGKQLYDAAVMDSQGFFSYFRSNNLDMEHYPIITRNSKFAVPYFTEEVVGHCIAGHPSAMALRDKMVKGYDSALIGSGGSTIGLPPVTIETGEDGTTKVNNGNGNGATELAPPEGVAAGVSSCQPTTATIAITWKKVAGADSYSVQKQPVGGSWQDLSVTSGNGITDSIAPIGNWQYRVRAMIASSGLASAYSGASGVVNGMSCLRR